WISKTAVLSNKFILSLALRLFALSAQAAVTATDNLLCRAVEVEHPLSAKGAGGSQRKGLPRTCGQMVSCEQAKQALKCGNTKLDRDKDGVPCESICPGG